MRSRLTRALAVLALASTLPSCAKDATGFMVNVSVGTAFMGSTSFNRVEVLAYDASNAMAAPTFIASTTYNGAVTSLPFKATVGYSGAHRRVLVEVKVYSTGNAMEPAAIGRATASFVDGQVLIMPIEVSSECRTNRGILPGGMRPACQMTAIASCGPPLSACEPWQTCRGTSPMQAACTDAAVSNLRSFY